MFFWRSSIPVLDHEVTITYYAYATGEDGAEYGYTESSSQAQYTAVSGRGDAVEYRQFPPRRAAE